MFNRKIIRFVFIAYLVIGVFVLFSVFFFDTVQMIEIAPTYKESLYEQKEIQDSLYVILERNINALVSEKTEMFAEKSIIRLQLQLKRLEDSLSIIATQSEGLRQAINPIHPEEVLTIARLGDRLSQMTSDIKDFEERTQKQQEMFRQSINRDVNRIDNLTILMIVALVPVFFQFISNFWRDTKNKEEVPEPKKKNDEM